MSLGEALPESLPKALAETLPRSLPEHVPRLVEIGSGPHITLGDLSRGVNCRVRCGSLDDRQQCTDMSVTIHTSEALLGM